LEASATIINYKYFVFLISDILMSDRSVRINHVGLGVAVFLTVEPLVSEIKGASTVKEDEGADNLNRMN
jgi:hypothetical protein